METQTLLSRHNKFILVRTIPPQVHKYFLESPKIGTETDPTMRWTKELIGYLHVRKFSRKTRVDMMTP